MKKIIYFIAVLMLMVVSNSCSDGLPDEQFEKLVLLTDNGWVDQTIDIANTQSGFIEIPVVVSISGTSTNKENVSVELGFDQDTLASYNFEKYREQLGLYYSIVPADAVSFEDTVITIPSDKNKGVTKLKLDLSKITDKYKDYVIPIKIKNTSKYLLADNMYTKTLLHLQMENKYSGNYTGSIVVYKTKGTAELNDETQKLTVAAKSLYALSDSVCYFYAGQVDRSSANRDKYIVNATFHNDSTITFDSPNVDMNLVLETVTIDVVNAVNSSDHRYENKTTTLKMTYKFTDISGNRLRADGLVSRMQKVLK